VLVWYDLAEAAAAIASGVAGHTSSVLTMGNFDGVHRGHSAVLARVVALARADGRLGIAVTFDPHPAVVHRPQDAPQMLTGLADKLDLLTAAGLDGVLVLRYTPELASLLPDEFVSTFLVAALRARTVVIGHDARFGKENTGNLATMVDLGGRYGFEVVAVDDIGISRLRTPGGSARWSSSAARLLLAEGDVAGAGAILGRAHRVRGVVVHGEARGRQLGFPTANLGEIAGMVPADGVYSGWLVRLRLADDDPEWRMPAAISIGTNPTFDGVDRTVEAHVLDRDDLELYDEEIAVEFTERLRPTLRFDSIDALIRQMRDDVDRARSDLVGADQPR
jgi:riboflavin kinase/FMN adenylyltransferase